MTKNQIEEQLSKKLIEMIEIADYSALKMIAEFIIKDCNNKDCSSCNSLKNLISIYES